MRNHRQGVEKLSDMLERQPDETVRYELFTCRNERRGEDRWSTASRKL